MDELDDSFSQEPPVWAIFGDLMSGLVGVLVLMMVWFLSYQFELTKALEQAASQREIAEQQRLIEEHRRIAAEKSQLVEEQLRHKEEQRRLALENVLAAPLASGRITLRDGRIGISGSLLFSLNSDVIQADGRALLHSLVSPLKVYLKGRNELLMISGFTDDLPIQQGNNRYQDNWELSAQRALNVTRAFIEEGMPSSMVFAAAFGAEQPVVPNTDNKSRSQNRRVEMAPVPRSKKLHKTSSKAAQ